VAIVISSIYNSKIKLNSIIILDTFLSFFIQENNTDLVRIFLELGADANSVGANTSCLHELTQAVASLIIAENRGGYLSIVGLPLTLAPCSNNKLTASTFFLEEA
jgi:hypothetical protein